MIIEILFGFAALLTVANATYTHIKTRDMSRKLAESLDSLQAQHLANMKQAISKTMAAAQHAGKFSRLCPGCKRVVHTYDMYEDGSILCADCVKDKN